MRFFLLVFIWIAALPAWPQTLASPEFFEKKIRPVLANNCQTCHNAKQKSAGLDLSSAEGFQRGGQSGPVVMPNPDASRLLKVIAYTESMKMPPTGKLSDEEIADIRAWVKSGAAWPGAPAATPAPTRPQSREFTAAEKAFWAFQPVQEPAPPAVQNQRWI